MGRKNILTYTVRKKRRPQKFARFYRLRVHTYVKKSARARAYIYMHTRISQGAHDKIIFLRNAWHRRRYVLSSPIRYVRRLIAYKSNRVLSEVATALLLAPHALHRLIRPTRFLLLAFNGCA